MDTPRCSEIPNLSADWKLNPNVECRIIVNKLKIKTPEYETMEFCRTLRNLSVSMEPAPAVSTSPETTDLHFKSEFVLDVLLNEILGKCEEKCKVCEEYVQQLRHHIIQAHTVNPNAQTVFKCDICSSIYSSPSMLIRHRNTHRNNTDTLTTPNTIEPEPVRFDTNDIYSSFDISSVAMKNESVSSDQCEIHPHQSVAFPPNNVERNCVKQESSQSELEMLNPNPPGIQQHMNHLSTIENNLKQEWNDLECQENLTDPLLLQDLEVSSFVKYESGMSTESEQQTVFMTHEKSSNDTPTGEESYPVPSDLIRHKNPHSSPKPHECDRCGKCFRQLQHLTRHKLVHTGVRPYKCDVCGKCFAYNNVLTRHKLTHTGEKSFHCEVCGKGFALGNHLSNHKVTHTGEKSFHCDVCGRRFALKSHLSNHKLTHTEERPHKCDECGHGFNRPSQLTQHKSIHHTGEKTHECDVCGEKFVTQSILTQHKLTHTERPHKCDVCGKCFGQRNVLKRHKLTHTGEKPFRCHVCGQSFNRLYQLTQHKLKHDWQSTTTTLTFVNHLKEERESEDEGCQEDPLLNLELSS